VCELYQAPCADATGFAPFITSMLRAAPAKDAAGSEVSAEEVEGREQQATASHSLSLAVCAALCRCRDVALDLTMLERLPLFAAAMARKGQGLTLVHCSAQLERFVWDSGCA